MIKAGLQIIGEFIVEQLVKVLDDQGHRNTGKLQDTMKSTVKESGGGFEIIITAQDYAKYVDRGIPAGVWVNVGALQKWVMQKGIATGEREIKQVAFLIGRKIFQEGSPTKGSLQFSKSGKRDEFIKVMLDANANVIFQKIVELFTQEVSVTLRNTVSKHRTTFETTG